MKNDPKERHLSNLQQNKSRNSPTSASIREAMKTKYPIGYSKKKGK